MNHYYLMASLPGLSFDAPPPFGTDRFRTLCREAVPPGDWATMERLLDGRGGETAEPFAREWADWSRELGNALAVERAARLGRRAEPYLRPTSRFDPGLRRAVADALARKNPRETERALDGLRWSEIERRQGWNPFSLPALLAYGLKLAIVNRWAALDDAAGAARAEALVESMTPPALGKGES